MLKYRVHFQPDCDARIVKDVEDFLKDLVKNEMIIPYTFTIHGWKFER